MPPSGQDSPGQPDRPGGPRGGGHAATQQLARAASALQARLGNDLWAPLDVRTKSCLVTSQFFHEMLQDVWSEREQEMERAGKRPGEMEAPLVDFSPVVLCLFKALEIEIERKVLRPFREAVPRELRESLTETDPANAELAALARFVRHGKPTPNLKVSAVLLPALKVWPANRAHLLSTLKRWMQANLQRPNRWWRDDRLCRRLQQAVDAYRNDAAHTGRLTPLEAQKAVLQLWGKGPHDGLVPAVLRATAAVPVAETEALRGAEGGSPWRCEVRKDMAVQRTLAVKPGYWLVEAVDQEVGDRYVVSLVPGEFEDVKAASEEFKARRRVTEEHLLPLVKWFPAGPHWGCRVAVAAQADGPLEVPVRRKARAASAEDGQALALALARAAAALHKANVTHGFISPYTVFRRADGQWLLGGQALALLAHRGCRVYAYPRACAPEVRPADPRTLGPSGDVYAIAATACLLRAGPLARAAPGPTPADAEKLFPPGPLRAALCRALSPNPASRHADAAELLAALTGRAAESGAAPRGGPFPVVISYSRKDAGAADQLIADLAARGISAWRDRENIPGGAKWRPEIVSAIKACRVVIFLASRNSVTSKQVPKELSIAFKNEKVILPVFLEPVELPDDVDYMLSDIHQLSFSEGDRAEVLGQILAALAEQDIRPDGAKP
jgi:hypothetical protein